MPRTVKGHWKFLKEWISRELEPMAGQEGTAYLWESVKAVDSHFKPKRKGKKNAR